MGGTCAWLGRGWIGSSAVILRTPGPGFFVCPGSGSETIIPAPLPFGLKMCVPFVPADLHWFDSISIESYRKGPITGAVMSKLPFPDPVAISTVPKLTTGEVAMSCPIVITADLLVATV